MEGALEQFASPSFDSGEFVRDLLVSSTPPSDSTAESAPDQPSASLGRLVHSTSAVEDFLTDLNLSLVRVKKTLHGHITAHHEVLLQRLANVSLLFADIKQVKAGVTMLQASTRRIRRDILTPIDDMRAQTARLARIQQASRLLRQATRVLSLTQTLRAEIAKFDGVTVTPTGIEETQKVASIVDGNEGDLPIAAAPVGLPDLPRAASLIHEIEKIIRAHDQLQAVAMVAEHRDFLQHASAFVRTRATSSLRTAVLHFEQNDASRALQVFFNMQGLPEAVTTLITSLTSDIPDAVVQKLDLRQVAHEAAALYSRRGGKVATTVTKSGTSQNLMPPSGHVKLWKRLFWERFDGICEELHQYSLQVWTLQRILSKKRDPVTHTNFLTIVAADPAFQNGGCATFNTTSTDTNTASTTDANLLCDASNVGPVYAAFWNSVTQDLAAALLGQARKFSFVKNVFVREYPLLRERLEGVLRRLRQSTEARARLAEHTSIGSTKAEHRLLVGKVTAPFLKVYLARSAARLNAAINIMGGAVATGRGSKADNAEDTTPKGNLNLSLGLPSTKAMKTFVDCVRDELRAVRHDIGLSVAVTRNVVQSVRSVLARLKMAWCTHPDCFTFDMLSFRSKKTAAAYSTGSATSNRQNNKDWKNGGEGLNSFQVHNCMLAHLLEKMHAGIAGLAVGLNNELHASRTMLERASAWGRQGDISRRSKLLSDVCVAVGSFRIAIVGSFWGAFATCLEGIVTSMHLEHYGGSRIGESGSGHTNEVAAPLSTFMQKIVRVVDTLLSAKGMEMIQGANVDSSDDTNMNDAYRRLVACRMTDAFVQHVALIRPLGARGRAVLRADAAALKRVVSNLLMLDERSESQSETANQMFAELDALTEIVLPDSEIPSTEIISHPRVSDGTFRPSLCFHHILSRAPPEFQLPHRRQGLSQARYLAWLEHGDDVESSKKIDADFATTPRQLVRLLVDTSMRSRFGLGGDLLEKLHAAHMKMFISSISKGKNNFAINEMERRHQRLARSLNSEDRSWSAVCKSMDAYIQRLGTSGRNNAPCDEYTLLKKKGHQVLLTFKRKSATSM